ncbi:MAG: hypothetical protein WD544_00350 [Patescibacteria group bacterium]
MLALEIQGSIWLWIEDTDMSISTLRETETGISRKELVGKLTIACRQGEGAKFLGKWLHDQREVGNNKLQIPIVSSGGEMRAIIVYPGRDFSYGGPISKDCICHLLSGIAQELGLVEILFYSDEGGMGASFLDVGQGVPVRVMTSEFRELSGIVTEII